MRWAGHVKRMGVRKGRILVGKPKGKRPFGRCKYRWDNNSEWIFKK
jgi:hypothetical protein